MLSGHQRITWRRNIAENFNRLSRVHERYRQTTDRRRTDRRQTDGRTTTYSEREHEFTFAKNMNISSRSLKKVEKTRLTITDP